METFPLPAPDSVLLSTKLDVPHTRSSLVSRVRLVARLDAGLAGRVTLISAPPGFGKTTLLTDWLSQTQRSVAWVSLDEGDNDYTLFLRYLVASLRRVTPAFGAATLTLLQSSQPPPLSSLLTVLINDLATLPQPCILVLDDYHVIRESGIHQAMAFLLDHLPPPVHLVISTREDPPLALSRLRARRQLAELRAADLRFTGDEATMFLNQIMGLDLASEDVVTLEERTEGWIAGLQLAGLSLRDRADVASFMAAFTGSNRFVVDYLVEEVLSRLPEEVHAFLLHTSILDRVCGPLCDALLEDTPWAMDDGLQTRDDQRVAVIAHPSSPGQAMLEQVERANLFLIPLDAERRWYRYHHLFADLLRHRLRVAQPELVPKLHRRASAWFEPAGLIMEAIDHAYLAQDFGRAGALVEQHVEAMWMQGQLTTIQRWLDALPEHVVRARPRLMLAQAWRRVLVDPAQLLTVEPLLREIEGVLGVTERDWSSTAEWSSQQEMAEVRGIVAAIRASVMTNTADAARTIALSEEALHHLPEENLFWRTVATIDLGTGYRIRGDMAAASETLRAGIRLAHQAGNHYAALVATLQLAPCQVVQGKLQAAETLFRQALRMASPQRGVQLPVASHAHVGLARLLYEWNDLEAATKHLMEAIGLARSHRRPQVILEAYSLLACIEQAQGNMEAAAAMLRQAEEAAPATNLAAAVPRVGAYTARLALARGDVQGADRIMHGLCPRPYSDAHIFDDHVLLTCVRLDLAEGRAAEVAPVLERLAESAEAAGRMGRVIELLMLRALALQALGDRSGATTALEKALRLAEPEGYVRTFVDEGTSLAQLLKGVAMRDVRLAVYVRKLLTAFPDATPTSPLVQLVPKPLSTLVEPLSERELEVLRLIASGLSNREIADRLVVALSTVKWYINTIYDKLGVHSRTQALARAKEVGLL